MIITTELLLPWWAPQKAQLCPQAAMAVVGGSWAFPSVLWETPRRHCFWEGRGLVSKRNISWKSNQHEGKGHTAFSRGVEGLLARPQREPTSGPVCKAAGNQLVYSHCWQDFIS